MNQNYSFKKLSAFKRSLLIACLLMAFMPAKQVLAQCTPGTSTYACQYMWITNVTTTGASSNFNNSSGCAASSFTYFSAVGASALPSSTVNLSLSSSGYALSYSIWIDFNNNNVFDASEQVFANVNSSGLFTLTGSFVVPAAAPVGAHRMRVRGEYYGFGTAPSDPCATFQYGETEDYNFTVLSTSPMAFVSSNTVFVNNGQTDGIGTTNNNFLQVQVVTTGSTSPFSVSSLNLTTTGCTNPSADITNAKVYYTGTSAAFSTATLFGTVTSPNGAYTVTGFATLSSGTNYFWVTYDLSASATVGHVLSGCCNSIVGSGAMGTRTPTTTCPSGTQTIAINYCIPPTSSNACVYMWISNVVTTGGLTNFSNSSGCASTSYTSYSGLSCSAYPGNSINVSLTSSGYGLAWTIYVDFNNNGVLNDAGEQVFQVNSGGTFNIAGAFTVPASVSPGSYRMRIRGEYYGSGFATSPCSQLTYGETEDYTLVVATPPPCSGTPAPGNTVASTSGACPSTSFTLSLQNVTSGSGVTYQWQSSPNGTSWTAISGATGITYTSTQTTDTYYECLVTCSGNTGTSNPLFLPMGSSCQCATYCYPNMYPTDPYSWIDAITTSGGLTNITSAVDAGYTSTVASGVSLFAGVSLSQYAASSFTLTATAAGTGNSAYYSIWADWNQNGTFDASELIVNNVLTTNAPTSFVINVPASATVGSTRLRVIDWTNGGPPGVCGALSGYYGETEDYCMTVVATPPCSGTPSPGNTVSTSNAVCPSASFTLSNSTPPVGTGLTYQWQSSPDNITWTDITGATAATYSASQTVATYYRCNVTCSGNTGTSAPLQVVMGGACQCASYCYPTQYTGANGCSYINSLTTTGGITNITTAVDAGFTSTVQSGVSYFPNATISQIAGGSFTISVQAQGYCGIAYYSIWADWNQNGTFDASELMVNNVSGANNVMTFTINIPASATIGTTRMRVIDWTNGAAPGVCADLTAYYGETEDYCVTVVTPPPCTGTPAPGNTIASANPACPSVAFTLSLQNFTSGGGVTYVWQSSPDGITWTNITGATAFTYSATQTVATYYQCIVTCSGNSTTSTPVYVTMNNSTCDCFTYCTPPASTYACVYDWIGNVTVNTLNNTTGCAATSYTRYPTTSSTTTTLYAGTAYPMTLTCIGYGGYFSVFVDLNQNGIFEASERLVQDFMLGGGSNVGNFTGTTSITIPSSALTGVTRMRVRYDYYYTNYNGLGQTDPCAQLYEGETEDYCITITPAPPVIYYASLNNTCSTGDVSFTNVNIQTAVGVPTVGTFVPRVYYKKGSLSSFVYSQPGTLTAGTANNGNWAFTIVAADMGGLAVNDTVYYFVIAQDTVGVIGSNPTGAVATDVNNVTTPPAPNNFTVVDGTVNLSLNYPSTACVSGTTTLTATVTGTTAPYFFNWSTTEVTNSISVTPSTPTTYSVTITDVCGSVRTASTTLSPAPTISASASPVVVCPNSSTVLSASSSNDPNYAYVWTPGNLSGSSVTASPTSATTYTVTGTDNSGGPNSGCANTATMTVTTSPLPYVAVNPVTTTVCAGSSVTLTANSGSSTLNGGYCTSGFYTYGCGYPDMITNVSIASISNATNACNQGGTLGYSIWTTPNPVLIPGNTYSLAVSTGGDVEGAAAWIDYNANGSFTDAGETVLNPTYNGTNPANYSASVTIPSTATPGLTLLRVRCTYAGAPPGPCTQVTYGEIEDYYVTIGGGAGAFAWSPPTGLNTTSGTTVVATPPATTTYTVTATDGNGCTNTATATVNVNLPPTAVISNITAVSCNGGSNGSISASITSGTGPFTYHWSDGTVATTGATVNVVGGLTAGTYSVTITTANGCSSSITGIDVTQPAVLVANKTVTNISCNGAGNGSISIAPTGGNPSYNYLWSNSANTSAISNLGVNTYVVTVTDSKGCTATASASITQPTVLLSTGSAGSNVSCNGGSNGSATVNASGGTSPYTGVGTFTGLSAGTFTFIVTDSHGCTSSVPVTISQPSAVTASSAAVNNVSCNGGSNGSASVTGSGGTPPYSGTGTFTGLAAGSYTYIITDGHGCTKSTTVTITQPAAIVVVTGSNTPVCLGDNINLTSSSSGGTGAYTYSWTGPNSFTSNNGNPVISSAAAVNTGSYALIVTDANSCTGAATTTVSVINCQTPLNLSMFTEGYYIGSGQMQPVLLNENVCSTCYTQTDSITVELHGTTSPYAVVESAKVILNTNGTATISFSPAIAGHSYYIGIRHRNTIQTWSKLPYAFVATGNAYDFSSGASQAYGDNMVQIDVSPDLWGMYTGDINQDQNIDLIDFPPLDFGINHGLFGYYNTDLNGDGNVDLLDFPILDANINAGIFSQHPF